MTKQEFYNTNAWRHVRDLKLKQDPYCELCRQRGIIKEGECVHHAIKFFDQFTDELKENLLTDYDNLVTLCKSCHDNVHAKPYNVWPEQRQYLDNIKNNISWKYLKEGTIIRYTEDKHKRVRKNKFN